MTATATVTSQLSGRTAAIAVTLMFLANGTVIGGYGGSLPSLRDKLGIDATHIAIMLFCAGTAAILAMQIGGRLADALGAREITLAALPLLIAGMITIGLADNFAIAIIGVVLIGLGNGAMDVSMNAIGAGAVLLLAALLGLHGAAIVTPVSIFVAVATALALGVLFKITPKAAVVHHTVDGVKTPIPKAAWILGIMALAFGLSEGTATDWSSLHVTDVAGVDPTTGALGLITVSAFMVIIRLLGDRLVTRFGRRTVVRFGALFAAIGYLMVTLVSSLPMLIVGWALVGFGVGMIAPQVYAVAGHIGGGRVLAVVVTFGYAAFLLGPAFMGFLVNHVGIHHAMAVPALLCAGIIALASTMPRNDAGLSQG
jgi:MFS family permease